MKLPRINKSSIKSLENNLFLTDTDDIGFARNQIKQIDNRIRLNTEHNLKPWERFTKNIYSSLNKKAILIVRDKKKNIRKNKMSFDWTNQNFINKTEIDNIKKSDEIKKQMKIKYEIKTKYKEPNITITDFISTKNETFLANTMINLLKKEKRNIVKNQESYHNALKYEIKALDKDMDKFNEFTSSMKKKNQESELLLLKAIVDNKNLVDIYKKQLQEYNSTIYEVYKHIKLISNLKYYAEFIHKLLGGDNDILHCEISDDFNLKDFKNIDIHSITKNIIDHSKNLIEDNNSKDNLNLSDPNTINHFDLSFKSMEERIMKIFIEKERYLTEKDMIKRKAKLNEEDEQKKCDILQQNYDLHLKELENKRIDFNKVSYNPEENDSIKFIYELLKDIYISICGKNNGIKKKKEVKYEISSIFYRDVVTPILKEINEMESTVNNLITKMEEDSNDNNTLFNKVLAKRKVENRANKLYNEKEQIKINDEIRKRKLNDKMNKIIFKGRYKYINTPPLISKHKLNSTVKTEMNNNDYNMLIYQ